MSGIQPKDLFLEENITESTSLRFARVLYEPKTHCPRCGAELVLRWLPWQSRCNKCKEPWTAKAVYQYHTKILGLVPRLPWMHHPRMGFSVQAQLQPVPHSLRSELSTCSVPGCAWANSSGAGSG